MAIPKFDEMMPSIIRCLSDNKTHTLKELTEYCAKEFKLNDADRTEIIESSGQSRLLNRVSWAKTYLLKAGIIESPKRANFRLTEEGRKIHTQGADYVTLNYLSKFDSFKEFRGKSTHESNTTDETAMNHTESPQEQIETALNELNNELTDELMSEIRFKNTHNLIVMHHLDQKFHFLETFIKTP